ncbi:MAG: hypothetical protein HGB10_00245 [Coriobacteriia bacterium]|nr:hypothetical protein [Coriobacteriia bacterium]
MSRRLAVFGAMAACTLAFAQAAAASSIVGTITYNAVPQSRAVVSAFDAATDSYVKATFTDSSGYYRITGLSAGTYHLRFTGTTPTSLSQWYDHVTMATAASTLTAGTDSTLTVSSDLAPVSVPASQSIEGTVTNAAVAQAGIVVSAYDASSHAHVAGAFTNAGGFYRLSGLPVGSYHVRFTGTSPASLTQYYDHKYEISNATTSTLTSGQKLAVSTNLAPNTSVTQSLEGTVTYYGLAQSGAVVSAFDATTHEYVAGTFSDIFGHYRISGLPIGYYHVRFTGTTPDYIVQFWDHQLVGRQFMSLATTTPLVAYGQTRYISTDLSPVLTINGHLTNNGVPVFKATASAYNLVTRTFVSSVYSDTNGDYSLKNLVPGSYQLRFTADTNFPGSFPTQYWERKSSGAVATTITCPPIDFIPSQTFVADSELATPTVWP